MLVDICTLWDTLCLNARVTPTHMFTTIFAILLIAYHLNVKQLKRGKHYKWD
jgi:hypothetical protein